MQMPPAIDYLRIGPACDVVKETVSVACQQPVSAGSDAGPRGVFVSLNLANGDTHPQPWAALLLILALQAKFGVLLQRVSLLAEVEVLWLP